MRKTIIAAVALGAMSITAALAQAPGAGKGGDQNDAQWTTYFQNYQPPTAGPIPQEQYDVNQTLPPSVSVYEFKERPEWKDYRFTMSGGRYYVIDKDRKIVRSVEMKKGGK